MTNIRRAILCLVVTTLYFCLAQIGLQFAIPPGNVTPIWLPSGFILAATLIYGYQIWPGIFLGALIGNVYAYIDISSFHNSLLAITSGIFNGIGDTAGTIYGAYLIKKRFPPLELFEKGSNIFTFAFLGVGVTSLISAILGPIGLAICGFITLMQLPNIFTTWFIGDAIGILLVTPLLLTAPNWLSWHWVNKQKLFEIIAYFCLLVFTLLYSLKLLSFGFSLPETIILPVVIWAIIRFEKHITIASISIIAAISTIVTSQGMGPFYTSQINTSLIQLQLFIFIICLTSYLILSYIRELKNILKNLSETQKRLDFMAHHDELTGLANRQLLKKTVNRILEVNRKRKVKSVILFLDVDNFKTINDSLGHKAGDCILHELSVRLKSILRANDIICRHGGDEFIIFIPDIEDYRQINIAAQRLINSLKTPIKLNNNLPIYTSISIGIAIAPNDGERYDELIQHADAAMYRAKEQGSNQFCYFDISQNRAASRALEVNNHLFTAIENKEFYVVYQPLFSAKEHKIIGSEALIRWKSAKLGEVYPSEFIPIAEQNNIILDIFDFILNDALLKLNEWNKFAEKTLIVSINVSPKQLMISNLEKILISAIDKHQIKYEQVQLEITENMMLYNQDKALSLFKQLNHLGIGIAIDDFGTGYSSLSYLR